MNIIYDDREDGSSRRRYRQQNHGRRLRSSSPFAVILSIGFQVLGVHCREIRETIDSSLAVVRGLMLSNGNLQRRRFVVGIMLNY